MRQDDAITPFARRHSSPKPLLPHTEDYTPCNRSGGKNLYQAGIEEHYGPHSSMLAPTICVPRIFSLRITTLATIMPTGES